MDSITVVTRLFVQNLLVAIGLWGKSQGGIEGAEGYRLQETSAPYDANFGFKKGDIDYQSANSGTFIPNNQVHAVARHHGPDNVI